MEQIFAYLDAITIVFLVAAVTIIALLFWLVRLERRLRRLTAGKKGGSLEALIGSIAEQQRTLEDRLEESRNRISTAESKLQNSVRAVETVKFNPFKGTGSGGNQSFATALIDEYGNGVVLLTLYARERVHVFAKPLKEFVADSELSEEEQDALQRARERLGYSA